MDTLTPGSQLKRKEGIFTYNYLDLTDIMSLSERVECKLDYNIKKAGFLDSSKDDEDLAKNTKLELPIWLAKDLYSKQLIKLEAPKGYNQIYRQIFQADANVVDLNKLTPYYYRFGHHLVKLNFIESADIAESLLTTFNQRIHKIIDYSLNIKSEKINECIEFKKRLDHMELELYNISLKELNDYQKWEEKKLNKIEANQMVISMQKRKQAALSVSNNTICK